MSKTQNIWLFLFVVLFCLLYWPLIQSFSPSLSVIHPRLFFFDFVLISPWVFAWVSLSFWDSFYPLLDLYPNLHVTQPPLLLLLLFYIFCLPSSWSHPKSVRYSSSVVLFLFRSNQSLSFCGGGPQLLLFFLPSSWPLPESLRHLASVIFIIWHILFTFFLASPRVCALLSLSCSFCLLSFSFLSSSCLWKEKRDGCSYCTDTK